MSKKAVSCQLSQDLDFTVDSWIRYYSFFFKIYLLLFYVYWCFAYVSIRSWSYRWFWAACGCWDLNPNPLEEQSVPLTAEPSLQPVDTLLYLGDFKLIDRWSIFSPFWREFLILWKIFWVWRCISCLYFGNSYCFWMIKWFLCSLYLFYFQALWVFLFEY